MSLLSPTSKRKRLTDVARDVGQASVAAERVRAKAHQRLPHVDAKLRCDHARGLVHHVLEVSVRLELRRDRLGRRARLQQEQRLGHDACDEQGVGVLAISERSGLGAVQVERAETGSTDLDREPEHGADASRDLPRGFHPTSA